MIVNFRTCEINRGIYKLIPHNNINKKKIFCFIYLIKTIFYTTCSFFHCGNREGGRADSGTLSDLLWDDTIAGPGTLRIPVPYEE
jgi:hypothetical protein